MRLKEMAVAMGAPIKPRRIAGGPHTEYTMQYSMRKWFHDIEVMLRHTEDIIKDDINRRDARYNHCRNM